MCNSSTCTKASKGLFALAHASSSSSLSSSVVSLISPSSSSSSLSSSASLSPTLAPVSDTKLAINNNGVDSPFDPISLAILNATPAATDAKKSTIADIKLEPTLPTVFCKSRARLPMTNGCETFLHVYGNNVDDKEHIAYVFGRSIYSKSLFEVRPGDTDEERVARGAYTGRLHPGSYPSTEYNVKTAERSTDTLVRIHSECFTGEIAMSSRCDCGEQLNEAIRQMSEIGEGVIIYLRQEGRGIGLAEKLKAYNLQDLGADTVTANLLLNHPADGRNFGLATSMLQDLGLDKIRLLTNNPDKIRAVEGHNKEITVTERVPMIPLSWQNKGGFQSKEIDLYLKAKIERMGHMLPK